MTEVPDYLLQRSRERRAALGLGGDEGGAAAPATTGDTGAAPATTAAAATPAVPAPAPISPGVPEPAPEAPRPNVVAARRRKRVPVWALPVLVLIPVWAWAYAGTLEPPTVEAAGALDIGATVYAKCASCHGAGGEGGVGPALDAVGETFADPATHMEWVTLGSTGWQQQNGNTYGDTNKTVNGGMPAWGGELTPEELTAVVVYERATFGGLDPVEEELVDANGNLLVVYNPDTGELDPAPAGGTSAAGGH